MPSREASLRNLEKARANWQHPPRPWRSPQETRVIKSLVWQWFNSQEPQKWSARKVARWLGVTHTYVQKLVREFKKDPSEMHRQARFSGPATFDQLERARAETRMNKENGRLREHKKWKWATFKVGDQTVRHFVPTKAEDRRQRAKANGRPFGPIYVPPNELPLWATGMPCFSPQTPCDPLAAVKHALQESRVPRLWPIRIRRRWRPGMRGYGIIR